MIKESFEFNIAPKPDLADEDYIRSVFENGTKEELERLTNFHNLSPEQVSLFCHFAKLRKTEKELMSEELKQRLSENPIANEKELNMGAYEENIESQVRGTVNNLRKKGYATYESGFGDFDGQMISFENNYLTNFKLPEELINKYKDIGVNINIEPKSIKLHFKKEFSLDEITKFWQDIENYFLKLDEEASPCQLNQAKLFREKQAKLKSD